VAVSRYCNSMGIKFGGVADYKTVRIFADVKAAVTEFFDNRVDLVPDYKVDLALRDNFYDPDEEHFFGVRPGPVGRTQRRFIIWFSVPPSITDSGQAWAWYVDQLPEAIRLVREYLPRNGKSNPAEILANELEALRDALVNQAA
jgi:hypothetical protein